ncbi:MAG: ThuA domain-containing protein [Verrucomicrobiota bacterium]
MKKALILQGGWEGHQPAAFAGLYAAMLGELGVEAEAFDALEPLHDPDLLARHDLIVPCWSFGDLDEKASENLEAVVRGGTGLAGAHGGMADAFRGDKRYQFIVGGQFIAHQPKAWEYTVRIARPDDPIVAGFDDFPYTSEQYYMHVDPANEVLADCVFQTAGQDWAPWTDGVVMPVVWKRNYGQGRVFYSALGHAPEEYHRHPSARELLKRGFAWALGD